ncbi:MAG: histidine phosphatase family protein [Halothece sp. Uz-M2-17]|nr:histidine phosphatase family protein [Halothece sp. Uz-M2-17]
MNTWSFRRIGVGLTLSILALILTGCGNETQSVFPQTDETLTTRENRDPEETLWSKLQEAETHYFVLMRHALAPGTGDPPNFELGDCSTQRNLSEEGRMQARRTGEAFKDRNIEVDQVLSSRRLRRNQVPAPATTVGQWCRCLETAKLLDLGEVEPFPPLNSFFRDRSTEPEQTAQVREFMREQEESSGITVMVTHFVNISALSGSGVSSGQMVVMEVNPENQLQVVGQIDAL